MAETLLKQNHFLFTESKESGIDFNSSSISTIAYNAYTHQVAVEFEHNRNVYYVYTHVLLYTYRKLWKADSVGKAYREIFKNQNAVSVTTKLIWEATETEITNSDKPIQPNSINIKSLPTTRYGIRYTVKDKDFTRRDAGPYELERFAINEQHALEQFDDAASTVKDVVGPVEIEVVSVVHYFD